MSHTAFYKITLAIAALLGQAPAISPNIYRARDRHIPTGNVTALNVQFDGAVPFNGTINGAPIDWTSKFIIDCYASSKSVEGDESVDPLLLEVFNRMAADSTLSGLVDNIGAPYIEAEYSADGMKTGWVRLTYPIEHRTTNSSLE
jgi:hypothetical protein